MGALTSSAISLLGAAALLLALAVASAVVAFVPKWRGALRWGRSPDARPISRAGAIAAAAAFLLMTVGLFGARAGSLSGPEACAVVIAGFAVFVVAGAADRPPRGSR